MRCQSVSSHWSPELQDRLHKQPRAQLVESDLPLLLYAVGCYLSPKVTIKQILHFGIDIRKNTIWTMLLYFEHIFQDLLGGRSWLVLLEIEVWGRSPGSRSEHWSGVAAWKSKSGLLKFKCEVHSYIVWYIYWNKCFF